MTSATDGVTLGLVQGGSLLLTGLGIGWLVGLSVSPVVGGVIASLLSIAAGVVVTVPAITGGKRNFPDARPAALLVAGIALGAPGGIVTRTYRLLEPVQVGHTAPLSAAAESRPTEGVLFRVPVEECALLRAHWTRGDRNLFVNEFRNSALPKAEQLAAKVQDPEVLHLIAEALCGS